MVGDVRSDARHAKVSHIGLFDRLPEQYFVPPYVGHRGWLGVRLDRELPWDAIAGAIEDAYVEVAPPALVDRVAPH